MTSCSDRPDLLAVEADLAIARRRLAFITRINSVPVGSRTLLEAAQQYAQQLREAFDVDACVIRMLDGDELVLLGAHGVRADGLSPRIAVYGLAKRLLETRMPVVVADVHTDPITSPHVQPGSGGYVFRSYAGVPMLVEGESVGVLGIYTIAQERAFTDQDVEHLQIVANQVAIRLANERLYRTVRSQQEALELEVSERRRVE